MPAALLESVMSYNNKTSVINRFNDGLAHQFVFKLPREVCIILLVMKTRHSWKSAKVPDCQYQAYTTQLCNCS